MAAWSWYQLAGHVLHWLLPVTCWNHPPGHVLQPVLTAPVCSWYHPVGQSLQPGWCALFWYQPFGPSMQSLLPAVPWYHATGHCLPAVRSKRHSTLC